MGIQNGDSVTDFLSAVARRPGRGTGRNTERQAAVETSTAAPVNRRRASRPSNVASGSQSHNQTGGNKSGSTTWSDEVFANGLLPTWDILPPEMPVRRVRGR